MSSEGSHDCKRTYARYTAVNGGFSRMHGPENVIFFIDMEIQNAVFRKFRLMTVTKKASMRLLRL